MAQKTVITMIDDLDGSIETVETVTFGLDGQAYEIDLNIINAGTLREVLADYIAAGRKVARPAKGQGKRSGPSRERSGIIRAWARANGHKVSDRGRIPESVIAEYERSEGHATR